MEHEVKSSLLSRACDGREDDMEESTRLVTYIANAYEEWEDPEEEPVILSVYHLDGQGVPADPHLRFRRAAIEELLVSLRLPLRYCVQFHILLAAFTSVQDDVGKGTRGRVSGAREG